jgi:hypothetical protein
MNAFATLRGRRFLPLLAMGCVLAGSATMVRADQLTSRLTDRPSPDSADDTARGPSARLFFASQGAAQTMTSAVHTAPSNALAALATVLIIPAGTQPMGFPSTSPVLPPPQIPDGGSPRGTGGSTTGGPSTGGSTTGGSTTGGTISGGTAGDGTATGGSATSGSIGGGPTPSSAPEPCGLVLALSGSCTALLSLLPRRRRAKRG